MDLSTSRRNDKFQPGLPVWGVVIARVQESNPDIAALLFSDDG